MRKNTPFWPFGLTAQNIHPLTFLSFLIIFVDHENIGKSSSLLFYYVRVRDMTIRSTSKYAYLGILQIAITLEPYIVE